MTRKWKTDEDEILAEYYSAVGSIALSTDMGRSRAAIEKRVAHLKSTGAYQAYRKAGQFKAQAALLAGHTDPFGILTDRAEA